MTTLTLEVTIRMSVERDDYPGWDDECIIEYVKDMKSRSEEVVAVRVAEPECHCWHHQAARQAYAEALRDATCGGWEDNGNQA